MRWFIIILLLVGCHKEYSQEGPLNVHVEFYKHADRQWHAKLQFNQVLKDTGSVQLWFSNAQGGSQWAIYEFGGNHIDIAASYHTDYPIIGHPDAPDGVGFVSVGGKIVEEK